ncbi:MAG: GDP-mannose 4,6-dehydratase [Erythrobacter sp.]|uniref:NAD-dependent epimerase/dehydratase family protein n=1 Tax=Erythrobacter sp. TaxID=1042 RepID=UPI0025D09BAE|nr:NAD-dependent epimerase/dehydratase family protein [Erythrobacter sp.]MCM0000605.1 GDP-mannose 4,6-dehydratase [Erythrobacter sp.]
MTHREDGWTLVAGGAGFIGSHLCRRLLDAGERVLCLDNLQTARVANLDTLARYPAFRFVRGDITHGLPLAVLREGAAIRRIYNLACAASPVLYQADPEHTMLTNVVGTDSLLRLAEEAGARFLLASTSEVYGDPDIHPQPEFYRGNVSCTGPRACYDEGKRAAETLTFDFARMGRAEVRVARIFNTYGPHMRIDDGRVISNFIAQVLAGERLTIYGDGSQTRSFCYVDDTVDALMRLMEADLPALQPVNIGNCQELTITELGETLGEVAGVPVRVETCALPTDDPQRRRPDISTAREWLGWEPVTPLRQGLRQTYAWFAEEHRALRVPAAAE